jgi:hypothetical protein
VNHPPDPLEAALRESPYLEDGSFTDGVLRALPPRRSPPRHLIRAAAAVAAGVVGAALLGEPLAQAVPILVASGAPVVLLGGAIALIASFALLRTARER